MEKLLLIGIDTRSMLNSALKLNYDIYSTSYFSTSDTPQIKNQKIILNEIENQSCGVFEDQFNSKALLEISEEYLDEVDHIIPISGVSPSDIPKKHQKKILGTQYVKNIEDKYKFYTEIKDEFLTPKTFHINDMDEALEIDKNYEDIQFILKPVQGSGGYNINLLNNDSSIQFSDGEYMLQEYVSGVNLSSSVLSCKSNAKTLINTRLLTENDFGMPNSFIYVGNLLPLTSKSIMADSGDVENINRIMNETSEKLARKFNLIGSSGVDYILNEKGLYVIEINPRIQGTFECVEMSLNINMLDAHVKACNGKIIDIPKPQHYAYKKIIYSPARMKYEKIDLDNIHDLPHIGSITEKSEPLLTIIDKDKSFEKLCEKVELASEKVNSIARKGQLDEQ